MGDTAAAQTEHGLEEEEPQPFSVVFAATATVAVQKHHHPAGGGGGILMRHLLCAPKPPHGRDRASSSSRSKQPLSRLSNAVVVVRAQPCSLHVFRGRKLCRVVEFPSPVMDIAGVPWGSSAAAAASAGTLCVAACRDGTAYALPAADVLEAAERGGDALGRAGKPESKSKEAPPAVAATSGGEVAGATSSGASRRKQRSRRSSSSSVAVGIFDDLAPTVLGQSQESPPSQEQAEAAQQQHQDSETGGGGRGGGATGAPAAVTAVGETKLGRLVMQAQERWAVFTHLGVRTMAACRDGATAAVAGIIDRAASYDVGSETPAEVGRHLGALDGIDGAAPTTSCTVWAEDDSAALGDGKGFQLPLSVFRLLFGAELSRRRGAAPPSPTQRPTPDLPAARTKTATVVLVGDGAGSVRWSPVPPLTGVSGGVFACLPGEKTAVVATLPQLDAESRAIGVLVVGANGTVLSLTAAGSAGSCCSKISRKRPRPDDAEAMAGGGAATGGGESTTAREDFGWAGAAAAPPVESRNAQAPPPSVCRRRLGLPFPVASACSAPGFLVHCHAGALFATALPTASGGPEEAEHLALARQLSSRPRRAGARGTSAAVLPLCPVRLPLPCDTVGVAVAPVRAAAAAEGEGTTSSDTAAGLLRTLVLSFSAGGRLVGFMAPQSVGELEGWSLDTGKGGVRAGGDAGVERRVRCQLERLSSLGRQCAALSAESAERDREIRVLRGATVLLPPLAAASASARDGNRTGGASRTPSETLGHSISMAADTQQEAAGFGDAYGGGPGAVQADALRVRLCVRLWPREGSRASGELQAVVGREDGAGRWFVVTRIVDEGGGAGSGGGGDEDAENVGERWAWSTSAMVPMGPLCKGWPWSCSAAVTLPSARPVTATSWLQFRYGANVGGGDRDDGSPGGGAGGEKNAHDEAAGVCVELGNSRFDVLDWGVRLPSVPRSAAAVRAASRGRGSSFCGPELAITDVFGGSPSVAGSRSGGSGGGGGSGAGNASGGMRAGSAALRPAVPASWSSFRLHVTCPDRDAGALLALLVPPLTPPPPTASGGGGGGGGGGQVEVAIRVAGQVAIVRATDCAPAGGEGGGRARAAAGPMAADVAVTCSHAAMAPLVREALVRRAGSLLVSSPENGRGREPSVGNSGDSGENGVRQQGDAAARLAREIYPMKQAVADVGDAARALGAERAGDGPSTKSAKEALALMYRMGEIYQSLRRQQETAGLVL